MVSFLHGHSRRGQGARANQALDPYANDPAARGASLLGDPNHFYANPSAMQFSQDLALYDRGLCQHSQFDPLAPAPLSSLSSLSSYSAMPFDVSQSSGSGRRSRHGHTRLSRSNELTPKGFAGDISSEYTAYTGIPNPDSLARLDVPTVGELDRLIQEMNYATQDASTHPEHLRQLTDACNVLVGRLGGDPRHLPPHLYLQRTELCRLRDQAVVMLTRMPSRQGLVQYPGDMSLDQGLYPTTGRHFRKAGFY